MNTFKFTLQDADDDDDEDDVPLASLVNPSSSKSMVPYECLPPVQEVTPPRYHHYCQRGGWHLHIMLTLPPPPVHFSVGNK